MSERQENLGRRMELRHQRLRLVANGEALRDRLRKLLPVAEEIATINREKVLQAAIALDQALQELEEIDRKLAVLNDVLG